MPRFKRIYLEITNICNLKCGFCPPTQRKPELMPFGSFGVALDALKPYTDHLYLHVKGEPLLHPDLPQMLDLCYAKGFQVNLTTNGTLIQTVGPQLIAKPALRAVFFSLHSLTENAHQRGCGEYLEPILGFVKQAVAQTTPLISLRFWNLDPGSGENLPRERNRSLLEIVEREFALPYLIEEKITPGKGIKVAPNLFVNYDHPFRWPNPEEPAETEQGFCRAMRTQVAVLVDGTVVPCCLDGEGVIKLGNLFQEDFGEIIAGARAAQIYHGFSAQRAVEVLCRKCRYKERFA